MSPVNTIGYLLHHTAKILYQQSDQVLQERLGIGMSQFKLLMMLQTRPGVQQRTLADCLSQTEASVSRQIKLLCDKGMLVIQINPDNRREHIIMLTPKGVKLADAASDVLAEYHAPVSSQFNEKQQQKLIMTLRQIHQQVCREGNPHACGQPSLH